MFLTKDVVDDKMVSSALSILKPSSVVWEALSPVVYDPEHIGYEAPHRSNYCIVLLQPQRPLQGGYDDMSDNLQSTGDVLG